MYAKCISVLPSRCDFDKDCGNGMKCLSNKCYQNLCLTVKCSSGFECSFLTGKCIACNTTSSTTNTQTTTTLTNNGFQGFGNFPNFPNFSGFQGFQGNQGFLGGQGFPGFNGQLNPNLDGQINVMVQKDLSSNVYGNTPIGGLTLEKGFNPFTFQSNNVQVIPLAGDYDKIIKPN
jgi:hypothetical protein